jgi:hypothetical protein
VAALMSAPQRSPTIEVGTLRAAALTELAPAVALVATAPEQGGVGWTEPQRAPIGLDQLGLREATVRQYSRSRMAVLEGSFSVDSLCLL